METKEHFLFQPLKRRVKRFGKYAGLPAVVLYTNPETGRRLVLCGEERFSVFPAELIALAKPIHGSPQNYQFNNDGTPRSR